MIIVLARVTIQDGKMSQALAASQAHVQRSRAEPGCIAHAVHRDGEKANRLVFVEEWADRAALQAHFTVPASGAFVKELAALSAEPAQMAVYEATRIRV